jgi:hypothetical protein
MASGFHHSTPAMSRATGHHDCQSTCPECAQNHCSSDICSMGIQGLAAVQSGLFHPLFFRSTLLVHAGQAPVDAHQDVELRPPRTLLQI